MYDVFRYSHQYSNHLQQRETRTCMMSSGILINIRITFNKGKEGHVRCLQVFSSIFESPSTKRNDDMYDVFRYSHRYSNHLRQRETRTNMYDVFRYSHTYDHSIKIKYHISKILWNLVTVIIRNTVLLILLWKYWLKLSITYLIMEHNYSLC